MQIFFLFENREYIDGHITQKCSSLIGLAKMETCDLSKQIFFGVFFLENREYIDGHWQKSGIFDILCGVK